MTATPHEALVRDYLESVFNGHDLDHLESYWVEDLSSHYGISRERVRQIEVRAFEKLQRAMKSLEAEQIARAAATPLPQIGAAR